MSIFDRFKESYPEDSQRQIDRALMAFTEEGQAIFGETPQVSRRQYDQLVVAWGADIRRCIATRGESLSLFEKTLILLKQEMIQTLALALRLPTETIAEIYPPDDRPEFSRRWEGIVRGMTDAASHPDRFHIWIGVNPEILKTVAHQVGLTESKSGETVVTALDYDKWCFALNDLLRGVVAKAEIPGGPLLRCRPGFQAKMFPPLGKVFVPEKAVWFATFESVQGGCELVALDYEALKDEPATTEGKTP